MHSTGAVNTISTHAPRTGSDVICKRIGTTPRHFNPRSPHGERQFAGRRSSYGTVISTHAPRTGSDGQRKRRLSVSFAFQPTLPARGATGRAIPGLYSRQYFNPRSPHGERQPTTPLLHPQELFQPTLPARGATCSPSRSALRSTIFQPTLPARGATGRRREYPCKHGISTHAPRTGSDLRPEHLRALAGEFQPTLPARGATAQSNNSVDQNHRLCTKSIPQNSPFEN